MESFNSTTSHSNHTESPDSPFSKEVSFVIAITITILLVAFLTKKDCATRATDLAHIEELERRKSCPERRKRAISKLIETKRATKGVTCEEQRTGSLPNVNCELNIMLLSGDNNECPICLEVFEDGQDLSQSQKRKCHHMFHAECLELWLMKHDDCPCCRVIFIEESTLLEDEGGTKLVQREIHGTRRGNDENV